LSRDGLCRSAKPRGLEPVQLYGSESADTAALSVPVRDLRA